MENNVVLEMRDISKNFTGVRALSHVDFTLRKGEIHALMGENGAGKSTLIKVLTGVHEFESGSIHMEGSSGDVINHSPQEAQANGISTVYQEVNLCPNLTVAENLFIGREPRKLGMINWREMNARSAKLLESLDINVPPTQMLDECSVAIQQMIAIARAVDMKCRVLILDEPTSSLDDDEVEKLFVLMRRLRDEGVGIIFVTHFLEQVYAVCDRITVLRNGELVGEIDVEPTDGYETLSCATDNITGVHDVYFVFKGEADELFDVDSWGFSKDSIGTDDPDIPDELTVSASTQRIDGDVCVTVTANDDISEKCVFTALYDENDVLIKCMSVPTAGMTDNTAYVIMSDSGSAEYAKVFVWDTISGMQPSAKSAKANIE